MAVINKVEEVEVANQRKNSCLQQLMKLKEETFFENCGERLSEFFSR